LSGNEWIPIPSDNDQFEHIQDILAAYAGYGVKYKKWGFKTGLRYEINWLNADFPINTQQNFDAHYANFIPSATITYMLKQGQTLKTGYNMRIQRPGIWYLNPYVNTTDTNYIRFGNPDLNAVKYHVLNLNYNFYNPKFNMNLDLSYNFTNNGIDALTWIENNISKTSYFNIAENKTASLSAYLNWSPNPKFRLYTNLGGNYIDVKANDESGLKNSGFSGNFYGGIQYTIPRDVRLGCNSYYSTPRISLQGENSGYYAWGVSANKSLLDKKLTLRFYVDNPLGQTLKMTTKQSTPYFSYESNNLQKMRRFGISVSYRFGEMKTQIKKTQRGIQNDDNMGGGNSGAAGGQQGGAGQ
jgi:outer membrane receptor protein involved in Fe transport